MNSDIYPKDYQAHRELRNCGFTPESINAIQSTKVITRDGAQHIVPDSQAHLHQGSPRSSQQAPVTSVLESDNALLAQLNEQKMLFSRHKNYTDQRLMKLETSLSRAQQIIKDLHSTVMTMKNNQQASSERERQFARADNFVAPCDKPIDRNRVAPSDVQVDKIFYCGAR